MPAESVKKNAELIIDVVSGYVSVIDKMDREQALPDNLSLNQWVAMLANLNEALCVLFCHQQGYELLTLWYQRCQRLPEEDMHLFLSELWALIAADAALINEISTSYCFWGSIEIALGWALLVIGPVAFVLLLPSLITPVSYILVFSLTCIVLPYFANEVINYGVNDIRAYDILTQIAPDEQPEAPQPSTFYSAFFEDASLADFRADVCLQFEKKMIPTLI